MLTSNNNPALISGRVINNNLFFEESNIMADKMKKIKVLRAFRYKGNRVEPKKELVVGVNFANEMIAANKAVEITKKVENK